MGFNFGAFAGGLAKGGMDTYLTLSEIERKNKEMALREEEAARSKEQFSWSRAEQEEKNKIREAAGVYSGVGGANYAPELQRTAGIGQQQAQGLAVNTGMGGDSFDRAVNESTQGTLRENAQRQGAAIPASAEMKPATYTREQADADYLKRVSAINPERALDIEAKQAQTAIGRSSLKRIKAEDDYSDWLQTSQERIASDPAGWLKDNLSTYNNAKKGSHLDDGKTADVVPSADGKTFSFVQKDSKGKVVGSTPITRETAAEALKHIAFEKYTALPGKFLEARKQATAERGVDLQSQELSAKLKVDLFGAQASQARGAAAASTAHAAVYGNMLKLAKDNAEAGAAMKPFIEEFKTLTPEEQAGTKGQSLLTQAATAAARKTGDITGIINSLKKPDADTKITVNPDGTVTKGNALYVPDPENPGGYKPAAGLTPSIVDQKIAAKTKQQEGASGGANPAAPQVAGRPFYNTSISDLQKLAKRPKGVSTAEANAAADELEARKGESRMSAIPR
jgi:hypothetical protein